MSELSESRRAYAEAVNALVRRIPIGRVMTYGLIAEILQEEMGIGGPRVVGNVLAGVGDRYHQAILPRHSAARLEEPQSAESTPSVILRDPTVILREVAESSSGNRQDAKPSRIASPAVIGPAQDNFDLPWWRVVNAAGSPPPHYLTAALAALERENTPMKNGGTKVDLDKAIWFPGYPV